MKKSSLIIYGLCIWLVVITSVATAQVNQGVYLSMDNYMANQIIPSNGLCKIQTNTMFNANSIWLRVAHKKYKYSKDSIYAYKKEGIIYRCNHWDKRDYKVMEQGTIIIYAINEPVSGYKNIKLIPHYYFSVNLGSVIIPLSIINIKKAFPDDIKLHHYLDMEFYQKDITSYNETNSTYQINYLFQQLNKQL